MAARLRYESTVYPEEQLVKHGLLRRGESCGTGDLDVQTFMVCVMFGIPVPPGVVRICGKLSAGL